MTAIAELLAPLWKDFDAAQIAVVGDRLEEMNRLDLKRILAGSCEHCGGELWYERPRRIIDMDGNNSGWMPKTPFLDAVRDGSRSGLSESPVCKSCGQSDEEAVPLRAAILRRVYRKLGLAVPPAGRS